MKPETDLFGQLPSPEPKAGTPKGYAQRPGSGPKGETCGTCHHCHRFGRYRKCAVIRHRWTHGPGTDVLARSPACSMWSPEQFQKVDISKPCPAA